MFGKDPEYCKFVKGYRHNLETLSLSLSRLLQPLKAFGIMSELLARDTS